MSSGGLVISLAPNERILINGAVVENGDRRARLSIKTPQANILRLCDAIHPEDATTPVKRAIYQCQLILSGDIARPEGRQLLLRALEELSQVFTDCDSRGMLARASAATIVENEYGALKALRSLVDREARMFASLQ
ncbi:flagellar biosynthesis repressor FlbT [Paracoccus suum]|uniref:Flagellar biosynthesis repressor FlbT n=1 Tax=Paracoccus suum TaxID=2259340 RepID=A0A344PIH6_9RHOB|nr:flagellar biosynthesis repressor FlbT [Paracoccus suum]AXC49181.1 flagellar biosynthesis repressor FlbT [Paracoccus suum]